jgi:exopolysaccharide production protein ExoZ
MLLLPQGMRLIGLTSVFSIVAISCWLMRFENTATLFYGNSIVFEFLAGVAVGHHYMTAERRMIGQGLPLLVAGAFVLLACNYLDPAIDRFFALGIPATVIVYAATAIDFSKLRPLGWLARLGDASFSIYLSHSFVLAGMRNIFIAMPFAMPKTGLVFIVASLAISVVVGILVHALFESRADRYLKRRELPKGPIGEPMKL